jgi:hypothetical protein
MQEFEIRLHSKELMHGDANLFGRITNNRRKTLFIIYSPVFVPGMMFCLFAIFPQQFCGIFCFSKLSVWGLIRSQDSENHPYFPF